MLKKEPLGGCTDLFTRLLQASVLLCFHNNPSHFRIVLYGTIIKHRTEDVKGNMMKLAHTKFLYCKYINKRTGDASCLRSSYSLLNWRKQHYACNSLLSTVGRMPPFS